MGVHPDFGQLSQQYEMILVVTKLTDKKVLILSHTYEHFILFLAVDCCDAPSLKQKRFELNLDRRYSRSSMVGKNARRCSMCVLTTAY